VFKRRADEAPQASAEDLQAEPASPDAERIRSGVTPKKGVPTPKRSEAESHRRQPYQPPADRKAASQEAKTRNRLDRQRKAAALQRGEEWALPAKDKGPVRALARDFVDARHGIGEYFMILVFVLIVLLVIPSAEAKFVSDIVAIVVLVVLVAEGWWVGRQIERLARQRFPGQSTRGVKVYAAQRGITLRRMRVPKPVVNRGDKV
jgi:Protein of unknown function (DUF3043)